MIIGETYRKIREGKGISISSLAGAEISKSQISRFELGETEISFFKLLYLLEKIGVTLEEFLLSCNNYQPSDFNTLIRLVQQAAYNQEIKSLLNMVSKEMELFRETKSHYHKLNAIFIESIIYGIDNTHQLSNQDTSYLTNYLFSVEIWGEYELHLFSDIAALLPLDLYFRYAREMLQKIDFLGDLQKNKNYIYTILLNGLFKSIAEKGLTKAAYFDKKIKEKFFDENDAYLRIVYLFA